VRSKIYARLSAIAFAALACLFVAAPARAQEEGVPKVVDEVIAQVNNEVITLSMLQQEMKDAAAALAEQRNIPLAQAQEEIAKRQTEIIVTLINEQLLLQKGKELGFADNVEKDVNERMVDVMKKEGLRTLEQLEQAMRASGVDPAAVRQQLRAEIMKQAVLQQEVNYKLYWGLTESEIKNYYAANKEKFRKPETVSLSEIFLATAGKDDAEVRARAAQIVAQLRGGSDFAATAKVVSEREDQNHQRVAPKSGGKLSTFVLADLSNPELQAALKNLKAGGITDPIKLPEGYIILRVDERTPAGEPVFDENHVREAIAAERVDREQKNYLNTLRQESFVEVAPAYRAQVMPLLGATTNAAANGTTKPAAATDKKDDKKPAKAYTNGNKKP
jgi:peptidyl-prolyl cis-trans isomerase SurA